jgi:hypothetical protein
MDIHGLVAHLGDASLPGAGALIAAWLTWRLWRRLFRAALVCLVVGVGLYLAFPSEARQLLHDVHDVPAGSGVVPGGAGVADRE